MIRELRVAFAIGLTLLIFMAAYALSNDSHFEGYRENVQVTGP